MGVWKVRTFMRVLSDGRQEHRHPRTFTSMRQVEFEASHKEEEMMGVMDISF
jgi:hypothetical protein